MADLPLDRWKVVSERIEGFDKLLLDVRLRVLGYSAVASGIVGVIKEGNTAPALMLGLLFGFILLTLIAIAIADATYYHQLLVSAVIVAMNVERQNQAAVPGLHTTVTGLVPTVPWLLYSFAYGLPSLLLLALIFMNDSRVGMVAGCVVLAAAAFVSERLVRSRNALMGAHGAHQ